MIRKLIRYQFCDYMRKMVPFLAALFVLGIARLFLDSLISDFPVFLPVYGIVVFLYFVSLIVVLVCSQFLPAVHFYKKLTKDEGYLYHTLPVSKQDLLISYEISGLSLLVICGIVCIVSFLLTVGWWWPDFFSDLSLVIKGQPMWIPLIIWSFVTLLVSAVLNLLQMYLAILLGQLRLRQRLLYTFLYGFLIQMITSFLSMIPVLLAVMVDDTMTMTTVSSSILDVSNYIILLEVFSVVFYGILLVIIHWISFILLNKHLNLQ